MKLRHIMPALAIAAMTSGFSAQAIKITYGPYLQHVTPTEVTVIWGTDSDAVSWVETAPDDKYHFYAEERPQYFDTYLGVKRVGRLHRVRIDGLSPGTTYRYRVVAREVTDRQPYNVSYGAHTSTDVWKGEPLRFTTPDPAKESIAFCVINDIHADTALMRSLIDECPLKTDFVVFNGDMVNFMGDEKGLVDGCLKPAAELFASEKPFYMVRGNHESRGAFSAAVSSIISPPTPGCPGTHSARDRCFSSCSTGERTSPTPT